MGSMSVFNKSTAKQVATTQHIAFYTLLISTQLRISNIFLKIRYRYNNIFRKSNNIVHYMEKDE